MINSNYVIKKNRIRTEIFIANQIIALIVIIIVFFGTINNNKFLFILPLSYSLICLISKNVFKEMFNNIAILIIILSYFVKFIMIPLLYTINSNNIILGSIIIENNKFLISIFLQVFEISLVFLYANHSIKDKILVENNEINLKKLKKFSFLNLLLIIFIITIYYFFPSFKNYYAPIISLSSQKNLTVLIQRAAIKGSLSKYLYWIFIYLLDVILFILPYFFIIIIKKTHLKPFKKYVLSWMIIISLLLFSTPNKINSLIIIFILGFFLNYLYPKYKTKNTIIIFGIIPLMSIIFLFIKSINDTSNNTNILTTSNAYFNGFMNVGFAISIENANTNNLFFDIFKYIPIISGFFKGETSTNLFNFFIYKNFSKNDQIIPFIGQLYLYCNFFAPILVMLFYNFALFLHFKFKKATNFLDKYTYFVFMFYTVITPLLYNLSIYIMIFFSICLPLLVINRIINFKIKIRHKLDL